MDFDIWWNSEVADAFRAANEDMSGEVVSPIWDAAVRSASPAAPEAAKPTVLHGELHGHAATATFPAWPEAAKPAQQAQAGEPERLTLEESMQVLHIAATAEKQALEVVNRLHNEAAEMRVAIAKKDAALKACALPESYVSSTLASDPTGGASVLFCFSDTKDAEEWHATITQAEGAMK